MNSYAPLSTRDKCMMHECFANDGCGNCDTEIMREPITNKPCPFFKTKEQFVADQQKSKERLRNLMLKQRI